MLKFIDAAISRTRTTLLLMGMVLLCGLAARSVLPIANDPDIELPFFYVGIVHEGISPEDAERLLVQPMEIELRKIEGLEELTATASEGMATLFAEFSVEYDLDQALIDVREAVDRAKVELPSGTEEPFVRELTVADFPMLQINLVGENVSERSVYNTALKLRDEIETVSSVLAANLQGQREELLEVIIDPDALNAYRISSEDLLNTLLRNNRLIPAGSIDT
ncbi:MAG: efflux RND transporter permease subunit, partial [Gammaproteobacteria bacterium]|nr:efflux RND transporter permease subunit [Gammaproteobacteria bacterium]